MNQKQCTWLIVMGLLLVFINLICTYTVYCNYNILAEQMDKQQIEFNQSRKADQINQKKLLNKIQYLLQELTNQKQLHLKDTQGTKKQIELLKQQIKELSTQINQRLSINQCFKHKKSMDILKQNSKKLKQVLTPHLKTHYTFSQERNSFTKTTNQQIDAFIYTDSPIPDDAVYYFQVKIQQTIHGLISIGVFTHNKKQKGLDCAYCKSDQMYYLYVSDGRIYHGNELHIFKKSKSSCFQNYKNGDVVTLFIDKNNKKLTWYVNGRYASSQTLQYSSASQYLYPFILMSEKNDEVVLLK